MLLPGDVGLNGLSADTPDRLGIDAGVVYANFTDEDNPGICIGALRGGSTFTLERPLRDIEVDGTIAPTKGLKRRTRIVATIECSALELFPANIARMIAGANVDDGDPEFTVITGGPIEDGDYLTNIALVGTIHGNLLPFVGLIYNALPDSPFALPWVNQNETVVKAKWTGHADLVSPYTEPWELWLPKDLGGS
jgi:hypothetical protein